jgi:hypothetical protein
MAGTYAAIDTSTKYIRLRAADLFEPAFVRISDFPSVFKGGFRM